MPVISVHSDELLELSGADEVDLMEALPKLGIEIEEIKAEKWDLEIFPDRCDMLSVEGVARSVRGFLKKETGLIEYKTSASDLKTEVDLSVQEVRPYVVTALIKNLELNKRGLKSLMDLQEKLHLTLGRERVKVAIGMHDFEAIEPPIEYKAVKPEDVSFVPLERSVEMNLNEILNRHEKGKEYAHILKDEERYPVLIDSQDNVLSFPPIINGRLTEVTPDTTSFFIDMTGTDMRALEHTLNILCTALADRGAEICATEVRYGSRTIEYPDLSPDEIDVSLEESEEILGVEMSIDEMERTLKKMRYGVGREDSSLKVTIPPYRHDILHPWDVIEDIAIGYDFDNFDGVLPQEVTVGESLPQKDLREVLRELLVGNGFHEVMNYLLTDDEVEYGKMNITKPEEEKISKVKNPVSEQRYSLRTWLLPCLLSNLKHNKNESLPQKLFEIGDVVVEREQRTKIAGVIESSDVGFTEIKSILDGLFTNLGIEMVVEPKDHGSFIQGRCAGITESGTELGFLGEISPEVLDSFELENPVVGFELDFDTLCGLKKEIE